MSETLLSPSVLASIGRLDLIARTVVEGFLLGLHRSPFKGLSQQFAEHRQYIAGDEVRHLDWRLYARTDRLYIKKFEDETNAPIRILLDASRSLDYVSGGLSKIDYARFLAAALSYLAVRQNDQVGLTWFDTSVRGRVPTRGSQRHLQSVLSTLSNIHSAAGVTRIAEVLKFEASRWKRRGITILISDLYEASPDELIAVAARIRKVGQNLIVLHLLDASEKDLPTDGIYEFRHLETGELLIADTAKLRKAYQRNIKERCDFYRREFSRSGVEYEELDTSQPLDRALALFLKVRRARLNS